MLREEQAHPFAEIGSLQQNAHQSPALAIVLWHCLHDLQLVHKLALGACEFEPAPLDLLGQVCTIGWITCDEGCAFGAELGGTAQVDRLGHGRANCTLGL